MNAKVMAFAMSALAVVAGIYVYNEFIAKDETSSSNGNGDAGTDGNFAGRRRRR